jgi:D-3-phosphoglycerate dehydrogenase
MVIYRSNVSTKYTGRFDEELISALPKSVKYIVHNGAGYDNIDVPVVTEAGTSLPSLLQGYVSMLTSD